CHYYNDWKTF
nr:immunoglobulin light chain junction region [Macaca mulatta]